MREWSGESDWLNWADGGSWENGGGRVRSPRRRVRGQPEPHLPRFSASTPHPGHRRGTDKETYDTGHRTQDTVGVIYDTAIFYHYLIILAVSGRSAREIFFLGEDWQSKGCARSKVDRIWRTWDWEGGYWGVGFMNTDWAVTAFTAVNVTASLAVDGQRTSHPLHQPFNLSSCWSSKMFHLLRLVKFCAKRPQYQGAKEAGRKLLYNSYWVPYRAQPVLYQPT